MRVMSCAVAMLACLAAPSFAQTPGAAYVEFGGNGLFYSVNGEIPVAPNLTVRVGGMLLPGLVAAGTASMNRLFGRGNHYLVLGAGMTFGGGDDINVNAAMRATDRLSLHAARQNIFPGRRDAVLSLTIGVHPWAGISVGKS